MVDGASERSAPAAKPRPSANGAPSSVNAPGVIRKPSTISLPSAPRNVVRHDADADRLRWCALAPSRATSAAGDPLDAIRAARRALRDPDEAVLRELWERTMERLGETEHRRAGRGPQRERDDDGDGVDGAAHERAPAVPNVLLEVLQPGPVPHVAYRFADACHVSEPPRALRAPRRRWRRRAIRPRARDGRAARGRSRRRSAPRRGQ